jgi:hypothetical protein
MWGVLELLHTIPPSQTISPSDQFHLKKQSPQEGTRRPSTTIVDPEDQI